MDWLNMWYTIYYKGRAVMPSTQEESLASMWLGWCQDIYNGSAYMLTGKEQVSW